MTSSRSALTARSHCDFFFFRFLFIFLLLKVSSSFSPTFLPRLHKVPWWGFGVKSLSVYLIQLPWSSVPDWVFLDSAHRQHILEISGGVKDPHSPRPTTATTTHRSILSVGAVFLLLIHLCVFLGWSSVVKTGRSSCRLCSRGMFSWPIGSTATVEQLAVAVSLRLVLVSAEN